MALMHVVRFHAKGGPEVLQYETVERPQPGPGQVLVRVKAIGMNFADVVRRRGDRYPFPTPVPYVLGGEAAGVVEATGEGVDPGRVGAHVLIFPGGGCYADYAVVSQDQMLPIPAGVSGEQAVALFVQGLTAALMLRRSARLAAGETVLVQAAAGGVGSLAVQLAKAYGAGLVIGCASTPEKRDLVLSLGADVAVDYSRSGWVDEVRQATQGRGVDVLLEMTGGTVAQESYTLLAPFGRSIVYGVASDTSWLLDTSTLPPRNVSVTGFFLGGFFAEHGLLAATWAELAELVRTGKLKVQIGGSYKLSNAAAAHEALENRKSMGKLILTPDELAQ